MPKHPYALYVDAQGRQQKLLPDDLHDVGKRALARTQELWDADEEYRLFPRYRVDSPHFYSLNNGIRTLLPAERDPAHDQRVESLLEKLCSGIDFRIGFYEWEGTDKQFVTLTRTQNYSWDKEVTRALSTSFRCRHDLFGASRQLALTSRFPWVAIEVVNHHYPDDQTFDALLHLTAMLPCVVLFDFIGAPNYFLHVDDAAMQIRVIYYLYDGAIWKGANRWKTCSASFFREKVAAAVKKVADQHASG